jgi:hypothetical protein
MAKNTIRKRLKDLLEATINVEDLEYPIIHLKEILNCLNTQQNPILRSISLLCQRTKIQHKVERI